LLINHPVVIFSSSTFILIFVRAPPDGYLPAIDDSLGGYEGSGGEEGSGEEEGEGRAADESGEVEGSLDGYQGSGGEEEGIQFDLPEYTDDADNLVEAENAAEETTENPTEDITEEPIENNLVEGEEDPAAKNAGETYQAPPGPDDIPEGDPANLPDVPPGPKDVAICPGGEVEVCIGVCPGTTARVYGACVQVPPKQRPTPRLIHLKKNTVLRPCPVPRFLVPFQCLHPMLNVCRAVPTGVLKQRDEGRGPSCFNSVDFCN
jgi:hypothetical protein